MTGYRVPFGTIHAPDDPATPFEPGPLLARAAARVAEDKLDDDEHTQIQLEHDSETTVVEIRGPRTLLVQAPRVEITVDTVLLNVAAMKLGLEPARIKASHAPIQVLNVGREILCVPLPEASDVEKAPDTVDLGAIPGVDVDEAIAYAVTQRTPFVKVLGRLWGQAEPMSALGAAAVHRLLSGRLRPTYPRTRVVGELVGHEDASCEITVQARKAGGGPSIERLLVGGRVEPAEDD